MPNTRAQFLKCAEKFHKSGPHHIMHPPPPNGGGPPRGFRQSSRFIREALAEEEVGWATLKSIFHTACSFNEKLKMFRNVSLIVC